MSQHGNGRRAGCRENRLRHFDPRLIQSRDNGFAQMDPGQLVFPRLELRRPKDRDIARLQLPPSRPAQIMTAKRYKQRLIRERCRIVRIKQAPGDLPTKTRCNITQYERQRFATKLRGTASDYDSLIRHCRNIAATGPEWPGYIAKLSRHGESPVATWPDARRTAFASIRPALPKYLRLFLRRSIPKLVQQRTARR